MNYLKFERAVLEKRSIAAISDSAADRIWIAFLDKPFEKPPAGVAGYSCYEKHKLVPQSDIYYLEWVLIFE